MRLIGRKTFGIDRKVADKKNEAIEKMLGRVQRETNVQIIRPLIVLCNPQECVTSLEGIAVSRLCVPRLPGSFVGCPAS